MPNQHIVPYKGDWAVRAEKSNKITAKFDTQKEAFKFGKEVAQNQSTELFLHGRNGQIRERNTYGKDPFPPNG